MSKILITVLIITNFSYLWRCSELYTKLQILYEIFYHAIIIIIITLFIIMDFVG
jgi:hypothetical protein